MEYKYLILVLKKVFQLNMYFYFTLRTVCTPISEHTVHFLYLKVFKKKLSQRFYFDTFLLFDESICAFTEVQEVNNFAPSANIGFQ